MRRAILPLALLALALMLLGCQSTGSATGGHQQMERIEQKPTTREFRATGMTPDQAMVFWQLWREHPPEKGASK